MEISALLELLEENKEYKTLIINDIFFINAKVEVSKKTELLSIKQNEFNLLAMMKVSDIKNIEILKGEEN